MPSPTDTPAVTFMVVVRNERTHIEKCLRSMLGQSLDQVRALHGVGAGAGPELVLDDALYAQRSLHRMLGGGGDGFVIAVRVQRVAAVECRGKSLERSAYVVQIDGVRLQ